MCSVLSGPFSRQVRGLRAEVKVLLRHGIDLHVHQNKKEPDTKCPGGSSYLVGLSVFFLVIIGSWSSFSPSRDPSKYEAGCAFWPHERWQCSSVCTVPSPLCHKPSLAG